MSGLNPMEGLPAWLIAIAAAMSCLVRSGAAGSDDLRLDYARQLLSCAGAAKQADLKVDRVLTSPEAFSIRATGNAVTVTGGGPAGVLYGVREWISRPPSAALPVTDPRHEFWKGVARRHIVNVHEAADVKPFRWGSPKFIREMAGHWKKAGIDGAEVYGMVSWRWPYALDKLGPQQQGTVLRKKAVIDRPGLYKVWARGLLAGNMDRSFAVEVGGKKFPPTHREKGPPKGEFVWRKAGELELRQGPVEIAVHDAGPGYECPDVIVLANDPNWQPP